MRAVYVENDFKVGVRDIDVPIIGAEDVLIEVLCGGVCGSDLHVFRGLHAFRKPPVMIGHEMSGIIVKVGAKVEDFKVGELVTVMPQISCGKCEKCLSNKANLCSDKILPSTKGWNGYGAFGDYFAAPAKVCCHLRNVDSEIGALTEPLAVATHMMERVPEGHSKDLVIIGAGTIGLLLLAIARKYGFEKILVTDMEDFNLDIAKKLGADLPVNVKETDPIETVKEYFGPKGCDNILVAAGGPQIIEQVLEMASPGANILFTSMIVEPSSFVSYPIVYKELNFLGSFNYVMDDFMKSVEFLEAEPERFRTIITHHFDMDDVSEAFELFDKKTEPCVKIILDVKKKVDG